MAGYEQTLDKVLAQKEAQVGADKLVVGVYQYNGGEVKLSISRLQFVDKTNQWAFRKLGRLTLPELEAVFPLIKEMGGILRQAENNRQATIQTQTQTIAAPPIMQVAPQPIAQPTMNFSQIGF